MQPHTEPAGHQEDRESSGCVRHSTPTSWRIWLPLSLCLMWPYGCRCCTQPAGIQQRCHATAALSYCISVGWSRAAEEEVTRHPLGLRRMLLGLSALEETGKTRGCLKNLLQFITDAL